MLSNLLPPPRGLADAFTEEGSDLGMLVAHLNASRVDARGAKRGDAFQCPRCARLVILHRGRFVVPHFKHRPRESCDFARGETHAHLGAKQHCFDQLSLLFPRVEVERIVPALPGDRRADVLVASHKEGMPELAIELQHANIGIEDIERRAFSYARSGYAQMWVAFLRPGAMQGCRQWQNGLYVERYSARPFERWIHGLNKGHLWLYWPKDHTFWRGIFKRHLLENYGSTWYDQDGNEMNSDGYVRWSRRWRELTLYGPHRLADLEIHLVRRGAWRTKHYNWPAGYIGTFEMRRSATSATPSPPPAAAP